MAEVTLAYQNIIFTNFQQDPYSHFAFYRVHINKYINTTSSISIRLECNCGLGPHCLLEPPSVGCGHKIVLSKNISYGRT